MNKHPDEKRAFATMLTAAGLLIAWTADSVDRVIRRANGSNAPLELRPSNIIADVQGAIEQLESAGLASWQGHYKPEDTYFSPETFRWAEEGRLSQGAKGEPVRQVQEALNEINEGRDRNFDPLEEDGFFGPGTHAAVVEFQKRVGLEPDGCVDLHTLDRLDDGVE